MQTKTPYIRWFDEIASTDIADVGGKNASLGEMYHNLAAQGVRVPNGFALTTAAYRETLEQNELLPQIKDILCDLDISQIENLQLRGRKIRQLIRHAEVPDSVCRALETAYQMLCEEYGENIDVAVRSSATAEDLAEASFAGQQDSYLNICGFEELLQTCRYCFASLFTDRAISYREKRDFNHMSVALSVGVQRMVRSDKASAGVLFSIDPESGFPNIVLINGAYGLGEMVVQGRVTPDEFCLFKETLRQGYRPIISKALGTKKVKLVYDQHGKLQTKVRRVSKIDRQRFVLDDDELITLAKWALIIEDHYSKVKGIFTPMDIEWAKDGITGELFIVQARPETVVARRNIQKIEQYRLKERGPVLVRGRSVGQRIGQGTAHVISSPEDIGSFGEGEVLVTDSTDPDWEPIMKKAAAIVTNRGGRTSHAAIVSRELGIPCLVGTMAATDVISPGMDVTVCCAEGDAGTVYSGLLSFEINQTDISDLPRPRTKIALNIGSPENVFSQSFLPNDGVGLARLEFIINDYIKIHPCALVNYDQVQDQEIRKAIEKLTFNYEDKSAYFVDTLAEAVGKIAAAFYPKPVVVRMSDFKSDEYAKLIGGSLYEPKESNPMLGWRGASRYYSERFRAGFGLECRAMKKVREEFGLRNVKLLIPFCRTITEAKEVIGTMREFGLEQGQAELEIYGMCEIPSNVILADQFLDIFDGFSIGTNDLTQLTLGIDRNSEHVAHVFDERNEAVTYLVQKVIQTALKKGKYIGICGDAPSTYPDFAEFLVNAGIETISLSPDVVVQSWLSIAKQETKLGRE